jgi:hypothetical protein
MILIVRSWAPLRLGLHFRAEFLWQKDKSSFPNWSGTRPERDVSGGNQQDHFRMMPAITARDVPPKDGRTLTNHGRRTYRKAALFPSCSKLSIRLIRSATCRKRNCMTTVTRATPSGPTTELYFSPLELAPARNCSSTATKHHSRT